MYGAFGFEIRPGIVQCDTTRAFDRVKTDAKAKSPPSGAGAIVGPTDVSDAPRVVFRKIRRAKPQPSHSRLCMVGSPIVRMAGATAVVDHPSPEHLASVDIA
jgi:hypothetical protein